ncbi:MAG TPA: hypothetical protein EYQ62_06395, partial [Verrucomicrobiales bacterium]|nr:hypothetical protein [Verrucomicrobiales bacterium]
MKVLLLARAGEKVEQFRVSQFGDVGEWLGLKIFWHELHDVADIRATVGKFATMPTGDIHAAASVHVDVSGTGDGEEGFLMRVKGRAIGGRV